MLFDRDLEERRLDEGEDDLARRFSRSRDLGFFFSLFFFMSLSSLSLASFRALFTFLEALLEEQLFSFSWRYLVRDAARRRSERFRSRRELSESSSRVFLTDDEGSRRLCRRSREGSK